jgi:hypothetical protein
MINQSQNLLTVLMIIRNKNRRTNKQIKDKRETDKQSNQQTN